MRENDLIARLGGDEFAIALVDITNLGDVMAFMNRLVEALRRPLQVAGKEMLVTTSVGIALAPADGDTAATVLRHAGIALGARQGRRRPAHVLLRAEHGQGAAAPAHGRA